MFKTSKEKHAYKVGIKKGRAGGKVWDSSPIYKDSRKKTKNASSSYKKNNSPRCGAYNSRGRVNENRVDDRNGPVVFVDSDFDKPLF